jgi:hypothetical protein
MMKKQIAVTLLFSTLLLHASLSAQCFCNRHFIDSLFSQKPEIIRTEEFGIKAYDQIIKCSWDKKYTSKKNIWLTCGNDTVGLYWSHWTPFGDTLPKEGRLLLYNYAIKFRSKSIAKVIQYSPNSTFTTKNEPKAIHRLIYHDLYDDYPDEQPFELDSISILENGKGFIVQKHRLGMIYYFYQDGLYTGRQEVRTDQGITVDVQDFLNKRYSIEFVILYDTRGVPRLINYQKTINNKFHYIGYQYIFDKDGILESFRSLDTYETTKARRRDRRSYPCTKGLTEEELLMYFPIKMK